MRIYYNYIKVRTRIKAKKKKKKKKKLKIKIKIKKRKKQKMVNPDRKEESELNQIIQLISLPNYPKIRLLLEKTLKMKKIQALLQKQKMKTTIYLIYKKTNVCNMKAMYINIPNLKKKSKKHILNQLEKIYITIKKRKKRIIEVCTIYLVCL